MPLANVIGKGGKLINEATAKAPPAVATWPATRLRTSGIFEQECVLQSWVSWLGHSWPPWLAGVVTVLVLVPGPQ